MKCSEGIMGVWLLWEYFWEKWDLKKFIGQQTARKEAKPGADVGRCRVERELRKPWREMDASRQGKGVCWTDGNCFH